MHPVTKTNMCYVFLPGNNIAEHFHSIAMKKCSPYIELADQMFSYSVPPIPTVWEHASGWHRYSKDGTVTSVPYPEESAYIFDVETLVNGNYPMMACAVSQDYWYALLPLIS